MGVALFASKWTAKFTRMRVCKSDKSSKNTFSATFFLIALYGPGGAFHFRGKISLNLEIGGNVF